MRSKYLGSTSEVQGKGSRNRHRRPSSSAWKPLVTIAASALTSLALLSGALGSASDPFGGLPSINTAAPKGADFSDGDHGVDEERGAATYSYPIAVPPGRSGMQPSLALSYSSQAPLRGGIAVGWSLFNFPAVDVDATAPPGSLHYRVGGARLVEVDDLKGPAGHRADAVYRAAYDASFTRWERHHDIDAVTYWLSRNLDGSKMEFHQAVGAREWRLTAQEDVYGNRIEYGWLKVRIWDNIVPHPPFLAYELNEIQYTSNTNAGLGPHAKVTLFYSDRPPQDGSRIPVGAQLEWKDGPLVVNAGDAQGVVYGARQLDRIKTSVIDPHVPGGWREVQTTELGYEFSDPAQGAQLRYLKYIDASAVPPCPNGLPCSLPATRAPRITFGYGMYDRRWDAERRAQVPSTQPIPVETGRSGIAAGSTSGFLDVNSDGLRDFVRVQNVRNKENTKDICTLIWEQGLGDGRFAPATEANMISLPTADWKNWRTLNSPTSGWDEGSGPEGSGQEVVERCTLSGQYSLQYQHYNLPDHVQCDNSYLRIIGYHFGDYDNNGTLDLIAPTWQAWALDPSRPQSTSNLVAPASTACNPPCGADQICVGGQDCWPANPPEQPSPWPPALPPPSGPGTNPGGGTDPLPNPPVTPHPHDPNNDTCATLATLVPAYTSGNHVWPTSNYNSNNRAFDGGSPTMSPMPLAASGEEGLVQATTGFTPFSLPTLVDIDGNGYLDVIGTRRDDGAPEEAWQTPRVDLGLADHLIVGYGNGGRWFNSATFGKPIAGLATSSGLYPKWDDMPSSADVTVNAALSDMNGDGLPDLVALTSGSPLAYYPNTGKRFAKPAIALGHTVPTSKSRVGVGHWSDNTHPDSGNRQDITMLFDVDEDGRPDLVDIQQFGTPPEQLYQVAAVRYGLGDGFSAIHYLPANWLAVSRTFVASQSRWTLTGNVTDVDGDGLNDLLRWEPIQSTAPPNPSAVADPTLARTMFWMTDNYDVNPPRLLKSVDNGHGAKTEYEYKATSKLGVSMPKSIFVVTKVTATTSSGSASPPMSTEYTYSNPAYGGSIPVEGLESKPLQFQGFRTVEVKASAPQGLGHGSDTVTTYEYRPDGRGYVSQRNSYVWSNGALSRRLLSVDLHSWMEEWLFDSRIFVVRPALATTHVCLTSDEAACLGGAPDHDFASSSAFTTYKPYLLNGQKAFFLPDTSSQATSDHPGDQRLTHYTFDVLYADNGQGFDYRVLPKETKTEHQTGLGSSASVTMTGREVTTYDIDHFPVRTQTWYGPGSNEYVTSARTFDRTTGLVLTTKRPEQVRQGSNGRVATYTYDANKVFAEVEINELGYGAHTYHDPGTGAVVRKTGPNMAWVFNSSTCTDVLCPRSLQTEESTWTIDGFGRALASATTYQLGDTVTAAPMVTLSTTTYDDVNNSVTSRSLIDPRETTQRWMTTSTQMDGLGRTLSTKACRAAGVNGSDSSCLASASNAVVSYAYDSAGLMISMTMPSPAGDAASVVYRFDHDSVGRETLMVRPDGSAMRTDYGPLYNKVIETGTIANGGSTVAYSDMDGNTVRVLECLEAPCDSLPGDGLADPRWSATKYTYDDAAGLVSVLDAEWRETDMEHDLLGRRTKITRGTRVWKYAYDHNGNMVGETSPMPAGESDVSKFTGVNYYDPLDRITLHVPASRGASDSALKASWIVPFEYTYDDGTNAIGRLSSVRQSAFTPLGASHVYYLDESYAYDGMGRIKRESRLMNPAGTLGQGITQSFTNTYNALGAVTQSTWDDGQTVVANHDDRGLVKKVTFSGGGNLGVNVIADYGPRNRAGLPLSRATSQTFAWIRRFWTYDSSGRVLTDMIQRSGCVSGAPCLEAQRSYTYLPTGELQSVTGRTRLNGVDTSTGFQNLNETFDYDTTHRLRTAHEATTNYDLALTFNRVGNIVTAKVAGVPSTTGPNQNRDVTYHYDWQDPQAVDKLVDNRTGSPLALMSYTPMGEMASRQWPLGTDQKMDWDGDGQLREVHAPDGTIERYAYDQSGQRIWAVKENAVDAGTRYWFGSSETYVPAAGTTGRKRYIYIADGSGALARTERADSGVASVELSFADALQNIFMTAKGQTRPDGGEIPNSSAVITSWFHYGAFGEVIAQGGQETHRRQFNGKESDAATGLRYYGARYYDPLLMRWNSADPLYRFAPDFDLLSPQRQNLYSFTANNPVRLIDPDGHAVLEILGAVACPECAFAVLVTMGVVAIAVQLDRINANDNTATMPQLGPSCEGFNCVTIDPDAFKRPPQAIPQTEEASISRAEARGSRVRNTPTEGKPQPAGKPAASGDPGKKAPKQEKPQPTAKAGAADAKKVGSVPKAPRGKGTVAPADRDARRTFTPAEKREKLAEQSGKCRGCGENIDESEAKGHHIERHADGGRTEQENHAVLCDECHVEVHSP